MNAGDSASDRLDLAERNIVVRKIESLGEKLPVASGQGDRIPVGDAEQLARRISELLADDDLRQRMGQRGRQLVEEKFSLARMIESHQEYYLRLLQGGS